jgi:hypothetical protein
VMFCTPRVWHEFWFIFANLMLTYCCFLPSFPVAGDMSTRFHKRRAPMAVLKRKGSKYWYVVIRKGGKQHWLSTKTEDKLKARQLELELLAESQKRS